MNILHISTQDYGGAGGACVRTHQHLLDEGVDSNLLVLFSKRNDVPNSFCIDDTYQNQGNLQKVTRTAKSFWLARKNRKKISQLPKSEILFNFPQTAHDITQDIRYKNADIITLHWVARFLDFSTFFQKNQKPVVWRIPDMFPFSGGNHYEVGFPKEDYRELIQANIKEKKRGLKGREIHVVALCKWMKALSEQSEVFGGLPHYIIPNGLNTDVFKPRDKYFSREILGLPQDKKLILFLAFSAKEKRKGLSLLLEALKQIQVRDAELMIVGGNSQLDSQSGLPRIHSLGFIKDERMLSIAYSAADIFVIPAVEDNLPNTVIESICCGTPVVGYRIGGVPDMVVQGKNGLLSEDISASSLADQITLALNTPFDEQGIRKDAVRRFDKTVQAKRYIELYETLLS